MAQRKPEHDMPHERGNKSSEETLRRPAAEQDKDDEHRAPESGDKPEASGSGEPPPREPDEI